MGAKLQKEENLENLLAMVKVNLKVCEVYKNFKELCRKLNQPDNTSSNSRKSQEAFFRKCFEYHKIEGTQQIMIDKIYDSIPEEFINTTPSEKGYGKIYKVTNNANNKLYIGQTVKGLKTRFKRHIFNSITEDCRDKKFYLAMIKIGTNNFRIELIEENIPIDKLNERENYWIDYYNSIENGYNTLRNRDIYKLDI